MSTAKDKIVIAALDLLRRSGLAGAGINQVIDASGAPKGSLYHYFPGGKLELVARALRQAEEVIGASLQNIFGQPVSLAQKVETLFTTTARKTEANAFTKSCPVAAVVLDIEPDMQQLRDVCEQILQNWQRIVAAGLDEVPDRQRQGIAELILATMEGALILSRATASKEPIVRAGTWLAEMLALKFPSTPRRNV